MNKCHKINKIIMMSLNKIMMTLNSTNLHLNNKKIIRLNISHRIINKRITMNLILNLFPVFINNRKPRLIPHKNLKAKKVTMNHMILILKVTHNLFLIVNSNLVPQKSAKTTIINTKENDFFFLFLISCYRTYLKNKKKIL